MMAPDGFHHVGSEDAELGGGSDEHQFRIGYEGREVGHGSDAEEDERGIPSGAYAIVENIEHGALLIYADFEAGSGVEGYVANKDTESDGHEEHRFEILLDSEPDEE